MWKHVKIKELDLEAAQQALENAIKLCDQFIDAKQLMEESLVTACNGNHPVYDALYVILARRNGCQLLSLDRKLITFAQAQGVTAI